MFSPTFSRLNPFDPSYIGTPLSTANLAKLTGALAAPPNTINGSISTKPSTKPSTNSARPITPPPPAQTKTPPPPEAPPALPPKKKASDDGNSVKSEKRPEPGRAETMASTTTSSTGSGKEATTEEHRKLELNFASIITSPLVTFLVGEARIAYTLHSALLANHEKLLALVPGDDVKKTSTPIELPHDDPEAFACLIEFLYRGTYAPTFYSRSYPDDKPDPSEPQGTWTFHSTHLNKYHPTSSAAEHRSHELKLLQARIWALARMYGLAELEAQAWAKLTASTTLHLHGPRRFLRFYADLARVIEALFRHVLTLEAAKEQVTTSMQKRPAKTGMPTEGEMELLKKKLLLETKLAPLYDNLKSCLSLWTSLVDTEWKEQAAVTKGSMIGWLFTSVSAARWKECVATNPWLKFYLREFDRGNGFGEVPREVEGEFVNLSASGWSLEGVVLGEGWEGTEEERGRRVREGLGEVAVLMGLGRWCLGGE
ncbi:hypothetical protein BJ508DRAFT_313883 [Ascobolus immersus RN42]|uniref:BTB domain-containing protein n=1 Tax=Ascobolus immersus RN42 TaxID=1160509 RepID=A0A3N4HUK2_ASCIM|nr:hypothetical protein BJ508DRAFT_313883 [Ascobolus immersus RN42]